MTQEVLKLALEALKMYGKRHRATYLLGGAWDEEITLGDKAITALEEALAQTQEPFAYVNVEKRRLEFASPYVKWDTPTTIKLDKIPLYTTPQQRTEQEPFCLHWEDRWGCNHYADPKEPHPVNAKPLYTTPPQEQQSCDKRTWVGLTDEDISEIVRGTHNTGSFVRAISAKLKQKNGYAEEKK